MKYEFAVLHALWPLLNTSRHTVPLILFLGLLSSGLEGVGIYLFLPLLNLLNAEPGTPCAWEAFCDIEKTWQVPILVLLVLTSVAAKNLIAYWNGANFARVDADNGHRIRSQLFSAIMAASPNYVESQSPARLANAILSETWRQARALGAVYRIMVDASAIFIFTLILFFLSWHMTLLVAPFISAIVVIMHFATRSAKAIGEWAVSTNTAYTDRTWETLGGLRTIRLFGREHYEEERHAKSSEDVSRFFLRAQLLSNLLPSLFEVLVAACFGVWIIGLAWSGADVPTIAVFLIVLYRMQPRVRSLVSARAELTELGSSALEIEAVKEECLASAMPDGGIPFTGLRQSIEFRAVSASYPSRERPSVENLNFIIEQNRTTAIVGPSGAGKSTIIGLLCRNMDPVHGEILVDEVNLQKLQRSDWLSKVAVVSQDIFLFDGTIRENILYGRLDATQNELAVAARQSHAHDFIMELPAGYDTEIGERGIRLSGGQRQRLALARALIRKPDILIIDEATNALDSHSEQLIQRALDELRSRTTIISVAHRLSTVRNADQILVIEHGRLVERGIYPDLLLANGLFSATVRLQSLEHVQERQ
jgi:subfamily B ATP-binding cassette protein MsbA